MSKYRKSISFSKRVSFLNELKRGNKLINFVLEQIFTGTTEENVALALDLLSGHKKLKIAITGQGESHDSVSPPSSTTAPGSPKGKTNLLQDLDDMAKDL